MTVATPKSNQAHYDCAATRTALMQAVSDVEDRLHAVADEAQRIGTLLEAGWRAVQERGLFLMKAPRELGGWEADPVTQIEVMERVAYIDTSAGWTLLVGAGTSGLAFGWLPDEAARELLIDGRIPRMAGAAAPSGKATPIDGGYRLSGRWQFGSGCKHAEWLSGGAFIEGATPPRATGFLFPREEVTIHDNWQVGGLKGSGSNDFSVNDIFVPTSHVLDIRKPAVHPGPLYRMGNPGFVTSEHAAFALGVGRRALDEVAELAKSKVRGLAKPLGIASRSVFQYELGKLDLSLRAARAGAVEAHESVWETVTAGERPSAAQQAWLRCSAVHATDVALDACRFAFRYAGGHSLFEGNVIERCLRDMHAAAQHAMVNDAAYEAHGQQLLGFADVDPLG